MEKVWVAVVVGEVGKAAKYGVEILVEVGKEPVKEFMEQWLG